MVDFNLLFHRFLDIRYDFDVPKLQSLCQMAHYSNCLSMTYFRDKLEKCDEKSNRRKKSDWCKFLHFFVVIIFSVLSLSLPFPESVEHDTNHDVRNHFENNHFEKNHFEKITQNGNTSKRITLNLIIKRDSSCQFHQHFMVKLGFFLRLLQKQLCCHFRYALFGKRKFAEKGTLKMMVKQTIVMSVWSM